MRPSWLLCTCLLACFFRSSAAQIGANAGAQMRAGIATAAQMMTTPTAAPTRAPTVAVYTLSTKGAFSFYRVTEQTPTPAPVSEQNVRELGESEAYYPPVVHPLPHPYGQNRDQYGRLTLDAAKELAENSKQNQEQEAEHQYQMGMSDDDVETYPAATGTYVLSTTEAEEGKSSLQSLAFENIKFGETGCTPMLSVDGDITTECNVGGVIKFNYKPKYLDPPVLTIVNALKFDWVISKLTTCGHDKSYCETSSNITFVADTGNSYAITTAIIAENPTAEDGMKAEVLTKVQEQLEHDVPMFAKKAVFSLLG